MGTTIGAEDDGSRRRGALSDRSRLLAVAGLIVILLVLALPGVAVAFLGAMLAYELRRVRTKMWAGWAAATFIVGVILAGSLRTWLYWSTSFLARTWIPGLGADPEGPGVRGWINTHLDASWASVIWTQAWFGMPVGFALTVVTILLFRSRARSLRGRIEGKEHSNMRPIGVLDRRRAKIERRRIADGHYTG